MKKADKIFKKLMKLAPIKDEEVIKKLVKVIIQYDINYPKLEKAAHTKGASKDHRRYLKIENELTMKERTLRLQLGIVDTAGS